jgi:hypothetical protein
VRFLALIPAHNEAASLPQVVADVRQHCPECDILVVDDASSDGTDELAARLGVRYMRLPLNVGVGAAVRAGLRYAGLLGHDTVVRIDGDGQHRADQVARVLTPIRDGQADAVVGSRYHPTSTYCSPTVRRMGQRMLARVLSHLTRQRVTDPTSGFWAFGPRAVKMLSEHHPTGYPEPELVLFLHRNGLRLVEVPTEMRARLAGRTSLTPPRAGLALARVLLAMIVVPLRASVGDGKR